jgi:hypothetical protein
VAPPVFKTGLAGNTLAGRFDSFPPPPQLFLICLGLSNQCHQSANRSASDSR